MELVGKLPKCAGQFFTKLLIYDSSLTQLDPAAENALTSDAAEYGIGVVMPHEYKNGKAKAVVHVSRSLISTEKCYSQIEKQVSTIIFAVKKFSPTFTKV